MLLTTNYLRISNFKDQELISRSPTGYEVQDQNTGTFKGLVSAALYLRMLFHCALHRGGTLHPHMEEGKV